MKLLMLASIALVLLVSIVYAEPQGSDRIGSAIKDLLDYCGDRLTMNGTAITCLPEEEPQQVPVEQPVEKESNWTLTIAIVLIVAIFIVIDQLKARKIRLPWQKK